MSATEAFSRQSVYFDTLEEKHRVLTYLRAQVRAHVHRFIKPGDFMLELNAGTGLDAFYWVQQGIRVHATDAAEGMLRQLQHKKEQCPAGRMTVEYLDFTRIEHLQYKGFSYIFSNFGGLNCTADLDAVMQGLIPFLAAEATITWVLMPSFCLREALALLRGRWRYASRRWRGHTTAHLEGVHFPVYYHAPGKVKRLFQSYGFETVALEAMSLFYPLPEEEEWAKKHPRLTGWCRRLDSELRHRMPWAAWGDHYIITAQRKRQFACV